VYSPNQQKLPVNYLPKHNLKLKYTNVRGMCYRTHMPGLLRCRSAMQRHTDKSSAIHNIEA